MSYLLNSVSDAARLVKDVDHSHCRLMVDTFHTNIEEKDIPSTMLARGDVLGHGHILGERPWDIRGDLDWNEIFASLRHLNDDGWLVVGRFGTAYPEMVAAAKIWRAVIDDASSLARDAIHFLRAKARGQSGGGGA